VVLDPYPIPWSPKPPPTKAQLRMKEYHRRYDAAYKQRRRSALAASAKSNPGIADA
jgi:hypothetical protein